MVTTIGCGKRIDQIQPIVLSIFQKINVFKEIISENIEQSEHNFLESSKS